MDFEPKPFVKNAADPDQVKEADSKSRHKRDTEVKDMHFLLSSVEGRRFLWKYLGIAKINSTSFRLNPHEMAYFEGKRSVGLQIMADIMEAHPEAYIQMMKEAGEAAKKGL